MNQPGLLYRVTALQLASIMKTATAQGLRLFQNTTDGFWYTKDNNGVIARFSPGEISGLLMFPYDASVNLFPATGGSGPAGAILAGDTFRVTVAGTINGVPVTIGDIITALVDGPAQVPANWTILQNALTAAAAGGLSKFAFFYQMVADVTGTLAANNAPVLFAQAGATNSLDITSVPLSGAITVGTGGKYKVSFGVSAVEAGALGLWDDTNGIWFAGSISGSGAGTQQLSQSLHVTLTAGQVISVRTDQCPAALTLALAGTVDPAQNVAWITLEKIG